MPWGSYPGLPEVEDEFHNFEASIPGIILHAICKTRFGLKSLCMHVAWSDQTDGRLELLFALYFRKCFVRTVDASHEHTFHQIEGLMIDTKCR